MFYSNWIHQLKPNTPWAGRVSSERVARGIRNSGFELSRGVVTVEDRNICREGYFSVAKRWHLRGRVEPESWKRGAMGGAKIKMKINWQRNDWGMPPSDEASRLQRMLSCGVYVLELRFTWFLQPGDPCRVVFRSSERVYCKPSLWISLVMWQASRQRVPSTQHRRHRGSVMSDHQPFKKGDREARIMVTFR